ncbi:MAG: hypothetical protein WCG34_13405, partial [Leptolinea sp.]
LSARPCGPKALAAALFWEGEAVAHLRAAAKPETPRSPSAPACRGFRYFLSAVSVASCSNNAADRVQLTAEEILFTDNRR